MRRVILAAACATGLMAQDSTGDDLQDLARILDQPVQAASKRSQRLKEAPADITVLRGEDLLDLGYRTLGDALGGVLGYQTQEDRAYQGVAVRGLYVLGDQNTRVLILLDGHPLNSAVEVGSGKAGEDFGIPLDLVERIEVIRGPASSLYGNNAFLGMVNVVTRSGAGGLAEATGSSRGLGDLTGSLGGAWGGGSWQALLSGMARAGSRTTFPELGPGTFPASLDQEYRQSAYLKFKGQDWSFSGYAMERSQRLASAPFSSTLGSDGNRYLNRILFADGRWTPTFGGVETLVRAYGDRNEFASEFQYDGLRQPGAAGPFSESDPNWSLGLELQARVRPARGFLLTVGGEQSWQHYGGNADQPGTDVLTQVRHRVGSYYAQAEWTPEEAFTAIAGLQESAWTVASARSVINGAPLAYPSATLQGLTPRLGLIWRPTAVDILKALYGGGFRNPTIFEAYYDDGSSFKANPALEPERIATWQGIWVHVWPWGFQTQLSASRSLWHHLVREVDAGGGFQQSQNDPAAIQGSSLEGEVQGTWGGFILYAQAGFYDWRQYGRPFPDAAHAQASLRATRHWGPWSASAEVRHLGGREGLPGVPGTQPSTVARAAMRYEGRGFWVRGTVEDLFNQRRTDLVAADYQPITRMAADGRTFLLTLGLPF